MEFGPFYVRGNADYTPISTGPRITGAQTARIVKDIEPYGRLYKGARDAWDSNYNATLNGGDATLLLQNGYCYVRCLLSYGDGTMPRGFDDTVVVEIAEGGAVVETRTLRIVEAGVPISMGGDIRVGARQSDRRRWIRGWSGHNRATATPVTRICTYISPGLEVRSGSSVVAEGSSVSGSGLTWYRTTDEPVGHNGYMLVEVADGYTSHVSRCDFYTVEEMELPADGDARAWGYNAGPVGPIRNFHWGAYGGDWLDGAGQWYGGTSWSSATLLYRQAGEVRFDVTGIVRDYGAGILLRRLSGTYAASMETSGAAAPVLEVQRGAEVVRLPLSYHSNIAGGMVGHYQNKLLAFEQAADPTIERATLITWHKGGTGSGNSAFGTFAPLWRMPSGVPLDMIEPVDRVTPLAERDDVLLIIDTDDKWRRLERLRSQSGHSKGSTTHMIAHGAYYAAQHKSDTLWHLEVFLKDDWGLPDGLEACRIGYFSYIHPNYRRFPGEREPADLGGKDIGWRGFGANRDGINDPIGSGGRVATGENGWSQRTGQVNHSQQSYPEWHLAKRGLGHDGYSYHMDAQSGNGVSHVEDSAAWHPYGRWVWIEKQVVMNSVTPAGPMRDGHTAISIDEFELYLDNGSTWRATTHFRANGLPNGVDAVQMNCYLGGISAYDPEHPWPRAMAHFVVTRGTKPIGDPRKHVAGFALPPPPGELGLPAVVPATEPVLQAQAGRIALAASPVAFDAGQLSGALLTPQPGGIALGGGSASLDFVPAAPGNAFADDFSGPAGERLDARGYTTSGAFWQDAAGLRLNGAGQVACTAANGCLATRDTGGADHYAQARMFVGSGTSVNTGVVVRGVDHENFIALRTHSGGSVRLVKRVGSMTDTTIATIAAGWAPGDTFRLEVSGSTVKPFLNGAPIGNPAGYVVGDAVFSGATDAGIWAKGTLNPTHDDLELGALLANAITIEQGPQPHQVVQRGAASQSAQLTLAGTLIGTAAAELQRRLETAAGAVVPGHDWATIAGAAIEADRFSAAVISVPQDSSQAGYVLKLRSRDTNGVVLAEAQSPVFTVGAVVLCDGGVNAEGMFAPGGSVPYGGRNAYFDGAVWTQPAAQQGAGALASALSAQLGVPVGLTHTASGGMAIAEQTPGGANWQTTADRLVATGGCELFWWMGGEVDIGSAQDYSVKFAALVNGVRTAAGRAPSELLVAVGVVGADSASGDAAGLSAMRAALASLPSSIDNCIVAFDAVTLPPAGELIRNAAGYAEQGYRLARSIGRRYGTSPYDGRGPTPFAVRREGERIRVSFDLNGSSKLTGTGPLTGWETSSDGVMWKPVTDAAVEGNDAVAFTGTSAAFVRHLYGAAPDVSNVVRGDVYAGSTSAAPISAEPTRMSLEVPALPTLSATRSVHAHRAGVPILSAMLPLRILTVERAVHAHAARAPAMTATGAALRIAPAVHRMVDRAPWISLRANTLGSLAEVKAYLRLENNDEDAMLESLVGTARGLCEAFTGQTLLMRDVEEIVAVTGDWRRLKQTPVVRVSGMEILAPDGTEEPLSSSLFDVSLEADGSARVRLPSGLGGRARVLYRVGLAEDWDEVPEPLRHGITRLVAHMYAHRDDPGDEGPPAMVAALWRPWRRMRLS